MSGFWDFKVAPVYLKNLDTPGVKTNETQRGE
jgi:hypothetical protein